MATTGIAAWIDGRRVEVDGGPTILEAAAKEGISIPTLCHDETAGGHHVPMVGGACRLCVVEIEGQQELAAACHTPLRQGQVVATKSPRVLIARRTLLELAVAGVESDGGLVNMRLQELVAEYGANPARFSGAKKSTVLLREDPLLVHDAVRCIRCDRCWRYCDANQGVGAIVPVGRGAQSRIATFFDDALTATRCQHCGGCATVCPTGSISERWRHEFGADPLPGYLERRGPTLCPYCGTGCQIYALVTDGRIVGVEPAGGDSFNKTDLCVKGRLAFDFVQHPDRLTTPLIKDPAGGSTISRLSRGVVGRSPRPGGRAARGDHASIRSVGHDGDLFQPGHERRELSFPEVHAAVVVGTNNVDNCARVCHSPSVTGLAAVFGSGAATNSLDEIRRREGAPAGRLQPHRGAPGDWHADQTRGFREGRAA